MELSSSLAVRLSAAGRSSLSSEPAFIDAGFQELIIPLLAEQEVFVDKAGPEVLGQMYTFPDKKGRPLCLIPEVTGVIQRLWDDGFFNGTPKPVRLFYISRCYRYERPQKGRYREFTQMGVEILGEAPLARYEALELLKRCLDVVGLPGYQLNTSVKRGLAYYTEDGFEVECPSLGAQKQVAGGGRYAQGVGWAIGLERLLLAL